MIAIKRTATVRLYALFVRLNGWAAALNPNYTDKAGQSCPLLKAAWILGLEIYNNINNNNIFFMYISSPLRERPPSYSTPLFCPVYSKLGLNYHNDVATAVAGKKVANV